MEEEQIKFFRRLHFPWVNIARHLGISTSTLTRRRESLGMDRLTDISGRVPSENKLSYPVVTHRVYYNHLQPNFWYLNHI